ncbi:S41 family peptidase [uncultured Umboniibacter sp.]|uniref:S41 family peptidase n=1 Tax=uncultured Umboniibacter sp. TaxID=1798917 RepID=UPI002616896A|nr:S41 family peptidase [uncultured Umboniibacter sp.]
MKRTISLLLVATLLLTGCGNSHLEIFPPLSDDSLMTSKIPVEQLHQDVDAFYQGVLDRHPDLANYASLADLEAEVANIKSLINRPLTRLEFYRQVGQLSHAFNDGHTFLIWPYQEQALLDAQGQILFPLAVEINDDGLFIKNSYAFNGDVISAGSKITQLNDIDTTELVDLAQRYVGGESLALREQVVARRFPIILWSVFGYTNEFELSLEHQNESQQITLARDDDWALVTQDQNADTDYYFEVLDGNVGYLYLADFDVDPSWFEEFVDETFSDIAARSIDSLIIDIRDNPGGNTDTVAYLTSYLADKPFRLVARVKEKLNEDNSGLLSYRGKVGEILDEPWEDWVEPTQSENHFGGDTYLLISQVSYSSAIVLATTLQDNEFATLIGQTTGGYANQTAQGNLFNLPASELRAYVPTRILLRPSGDSTVQGVIPEVITRHDAQSLQSGEDTEVAAALAIIEEKGARDASLNVSMDSRED